MTQLPAEPLPLDAGALIQALLSGKSPRTIEAYHWDLKDFATFAGEIEPITALTNLLSAHNGQANMIVLHYRQSLLEKGLSPATINRRLSALRSTVKLARTLGYIIWALDVPNVKHEAYRDTRGPSHEEVIETMERAKNSPRDYAILWMLYGRAFRRGEVAELEVADCDLKRGIVMIQGKGRKEKSPYSIPPEAVKALSAWLKIRKIEGNSVFGITGRHIERIFKKYNHGHSPHGFRHSAITRARDLGFSIRDVQQFARLANVQTIQRYDDNRMDLGGKVANKISEEI